MGLIAGADIGGTFTDLVLYDPATGFAATHKTSTGDDPAAGLVEALADLCTRSRVAPTSVDSLFHGTTIATNALLQHDGAKAGFVTTRGFRDVLHIGRHQRPQHYSIMQDIPWQARPLVRRRHRKVLRAASSMPPTPI